jgi:hypothetical protein
MKTRIFKILGVAVTLAMVLTLAAAFSAPAAASPDETINEWYKFDYPEPGEDGDWFYDPTIGSVGPIAEAINGDLYAAVSFGQDARFDVIAGNMDIWTLDANTGYISALIWGDYSSADELRSGFFTARWCFDSEFIEGWVYACGIIAEADVGFDILYYSGYIIGDFVPGDWDIDSGAFDLLANGKLEGSFDIEGELVYFCGSYELGGSLMKSTDGGRTWEKTGYEDVEIDLPEDTYIVPPGPVVDMVCSSIDEDIIYVTDGSYVYKSTDGGDEFDFVARDSLEEELVGECGCPILFCPITSIDVTYDEDDNPFVFIGTREHWGDDGPGCAYDVWMPGDVYYIGEAGYPANWTSLNLQCFHGGGYEALAVGCAPDWAETKETYVVVTTPDDPSLAPTPDDPHTWVVYTKGTVCGWYEFAELLWDCTDNFGSFLASRIGFPDDWEDTETLFVGVVDEYPCTDCWECDTDVWCGCGGDVYLATDGDAIDLNVAGIITGCEGEESVDIVSLDVMGDTDEAQLIAGAFCSTDVYYSTDGGWSWDESEKDPTGSWATYVLWYEDTAVAGTACCNAAFSISCGEEVGEFWNQGSLISTAIDCVNYIDHSPGYLDDSETLFMITKDCDACFVCDCEEGSYDIDTLSVFRHDGTYWERVFLNITGPLRRTEWQVHVSPDFLTTNCVYVGNEYFEMWRSTDAGCSWDQLTFPCEPRPCISAWEVIDEDTVIAGGACWFDLYPCEDACGYVYKTTRHGARPWKEYEYETTDPGDVISFALEPGYEDPGTVLLGDNKSRVYISEDGGETWDLVGKALFNPIWHPTWVAFDPGYATNHIIYAAAQYKIARCIIDPDEDWADQEWEVLCDQLGYADGIQAAGDTALYVTDRETYGDLVNCGVFRSLNPDAEDADDVVFEELVDGLDPWTSLRNLWLTTDVSDDGCTENVLWSLEWEKNCDYCEGAGPDIWVWEDTLAQPVVLDMPLDEQKLTKTTEATLSWNELCGADCYEVSLYSYCAECPDNKLEVDLCLDCEPGETVICGPEIDCWEVDEELWCCPCTEDTCIVVDDLEPGTTYYWQVRVCQGKPYLSKWSEERTFTTALLPVPFAELCSPECGSQDIILTPNFAWGEVDGATGYEVQLSTTETFTVGVVKGKTTVNAWVCPTTLEYATTYYWRVRAEKDGIYSDWTYCMFTTMPEPEAPTPPVVVEEVPPSPPPVINIPPAEMITPTWIYAIIGIGASLAIVVIVLIVRTRRPPA